MLTYKFRTAKPCLELHGAGDVGLLEEQDLLRVSNAVVDVVAGGAVGKNLGRALGHMRVPVAALGDTQAEVLRLEELVQVARWREEIVGAKFVDLEGGLGVVDDVAAVEGFAQAEA